MVSWFPYFYDTLKPGNKTGLKAKDLSYFSKMA
jgi:hypothetical protein